MMDERQVAASPLRPIGVKSNPLLAPVHTISEVRKNRFLVRNLIRREIRGRYRNAALGYAWTVIEPAFKVKLESSCSTVPVLVST